MSKTAQEVGFRLLSFLAWLMIQVIGRTSRFTVKGYNHVQELIRDGRGFIMLVWHGRTMLPVYYCRGMGIQAVVSLSRDGELQARILSRLGFVIIRGSSGRGGMKAALTAVKRLQEGGTLAITPDGPKGPPTEVQEGTVFLARKAGVPIVPIGVGARPRKLLPTWDSYALPVPFCRCALVFGEPIQLSDEFEHSLPVDILLKNALNDVQREAQLMVGEGC